MLRGVKLLPWVAVFIVMVSGCAAMKRKSAATPVSTPAFSPVPTVPTVPPTTPTPTPEAGAPLPTRPIGNPEAEAARKAGKAIGPVVTHFGLARADGYASEPESVGKDGVPTYVAGVGSGFMIVVEGKPGLGNVEPGRRVFAYKPDDPNSRPDLEIESTRDLGDGSPAVCDRRRPNIGGIPGIDPPSFAATKKVAEALNDFSCRFETFIESMSACTLTKHGDFAFINPASTVQFCMIVARAWNFPMGDTLLSVRLRDKDGNPGPVKTLRLRRVERLRPTPGVQPTKTPTPSRRRP